MLEMSDEILTVTCVNMSFVSCLRFTSLI